MTERGHSDSGVINHQENKSLNTMADMNYHPFSDEGSESGEPPKPDGDGDHALHAVDVEPSVEMSGQSTGGRGPRRPHGGMVYKSVGCSKIMAICLLLFILASIMMIALVASFARPGCISVGNVTAETLPEPKPTVPLDTDGKVFPWRSIRLPNSIRPLNYTLFLHPNLTTSAVLGHVAITIEVVPGATDATDCIVFHAIDMNVTMPKSITVSSTGNSRSPTIISVTKMQRYKKNEMVYLSLAQSLRVGQIYKLELDFDYTLGDGLNGFYRSTYKVGTEERVLATTQMEPTDARRAFPCFDEPSLKATFQITIIRNEKYISLSNMPLRESTPYTKGVNLVQDEYQTSVIMSTYLVAFVICDFKNISSMTESLIPAKQQHGVDNVKVAVYASEDKLEQTQLALDVLKYTIEKYEQYFGIKYPLPKQDMIAIPDFSAGAMENWGLITYRQASILNAENVTSDSSKQWIVQTITHELAHQWFGNYVTMEWWTDLWLNEGFATYVEYIGTEYYQNKYNWNWRMMDLFVIDTAQNAMYDDSKADSHPILVKVESPGQINEIFDSISYSKGASIIRMLNEFVTEDVFKKGLTLYLNKHKYSNAQTVDLWNAISDASKDAGDHHPDFSVADMMDTWTLQMGYPVVNLNRNGRVVTAKQQHFLLYSKAKASTEFTSPFDYKWTIPLTLVTDSNPQPTNHNDIRSVLFKKNQGSTTINLPSTSTQWYKANYKQTGYYRVNYDHINWQRLKEQLKTYHTVFTPTDRAGIIDDAFNLAWAGQLDYTIPLEISEYLRNEDDFIPWASASAGLGAIGVVLRSKEGYPYYQQYILKLLGPTLETIGWMDTGSHLERKKRVSVLYRAVVYGHSASVNTALLKFKNWKENNDSVIANLKAAVYCGGVMYGRQDDWDYVWNKYQVSNIPTEKRMLQQALACTLSPTLINKYLYLSIDKDQIRQQDSISVIASVASHPAGASAAVKFVIDNWDIIIERYGAASFDLSDLISSITTSISSQFEYDQIQSFLSKNAEAAKAGQRAIAQALETMKMNIDWLKVNEALVTKWFKDKVSGNTV